MTPDPLRPTDSPMETNQPSSSDQFSPEELACQAALRAVEENRVKIVSVAAQDIYRLIELLTDIPRGSVLLRVGYDVTTHVFNLFVSNPAFDPVSPCEHPRVLGPSHLASHTDYSITIIVSAHSFCSVPRILGHDRIALRKLDLTGDGSAMRHVMESCAPILDLIPGLLPADTVDDGD